MSYFEQLTATQFRCRFCNTTMNKETAPLHRCLQSDKNRKDPPEAPCEMPKPVEYTIKEGGHWRSWEETKGMRIMNPIHAIKFDNGRIFDMVNGWRPVEKPKSDLRLVERRLLEELQILINNGQMLAVNTLLAQMLAIEKDELSDPPVKQRFTTMRDITGEICPLCRVGTIRKNLSSHAFECNNCGSSAPLK